MNKSIMIDTTVMASTTASKDGTSGSTTLTVTSLPRGPSTFGFVAKDAGLVFEINATDFTDNIIIWTDGSNLSTNFFTMWVDGLGVWYALSGSVYAGDIADEAQDRGLTSGDFMGFEIFGMNGNDTIIADGTGTVGTLPGATIGPTSIPLILTGMHLFVNGGE
jgi:hypothetical protein